MLLDNRQLPFADTFIDEYATRSDYGFAVLAQAGSGWDITEHDKSGFAIIRCKLETRFLKCARMRDAIAGALNGATIMSRVAHRVAP
jgi:hypothetical protein